MKVSLNSLQNIYRYFQTGDDATVVGPEALAQKIGSQLGEIDELVDLGSKYQNVLIVKVVTCDSHPDADKLHVCKIDDGGKAEGVERDENGYVQVVCGAPNVHAGMLAVWLPPNSTVPETVGKEPFVLGSRELRGVMSNGMLSSAKELAFGDSHEGLLVVEGDYAPGTDFAEATGLKNDFVFDIENKMFTHRPDCFGILGVAREVAGIQGVAFKSPDWYSLNVSIEDAGANDLPLVIKNEIPELTPRFTAVTMSGVKVAPSPLWLQVELVKAGIRPISNLVDIGNYIMLLTGQPVHIYDYDKVKAHDGGDVATLVARKPAKDEELTLLSGKTIKPRIDAVVIATETKIIGLAGVMGGADTEVDDSTTNIIIECANFNMYSIRKTSMEHGIFSDAVTRFNKGQSPLQTPAVMCKIVEAIKDLTGAQIASSVIDDNHLDDLVMQSGSLNNPVVITSDYINVRLGSSLDTEAMQKLLTNVEFEVSLKGNELTVKAPFWRTDIEIKEDIVEEIGRLYGYDHLPLILPSRDLSPVVKDPMLVLKEQIRDVLADRGANEVLTYSFVHGNLIDKVKQNKEEAYALSNALSPDLQYYRLSVLPSLLDKVHSNIKAGYDEFALFELGQTHSISHSTSEDGIPVEIPVLAFVLASDDKLNRPGAAFYQGRLYLESLMNQLGQSGNLEFAKGDTPAMFADGRSAIVMLNGNGIGTIGELKADVRKKLKLPQYSVGFEINLEALLESESKKDYVQLPRFPKVTQDLTLKVPSSKLYSEVDKALRHELKANQPEHTLPGLESLYIYKPEDDKDHVNVSWRYSLASYDRTLTAEEVNKVLEAAVAGLGQQGITRI